MAASTILSSSFFIKYSADNNFDTIVVLFLKKN